MILWIVLALVVAGISVYSILRKGFSGLPLVLGVWGLFFTGLAAVAWFPPTIGKLVLLAFMGGVSITLIAWGIANIMINKLIESSFHEKIKLPGNLFIKATKASKSPYGVLYGFLPWSDEGAGYFANFLREKVWGQGYKVTHLCVEYTEFGGTSVAAIWGIIRPKTIIDRILY